MTIPSGHINEAPELTGLGNNVTSGKSSDKIKAIHAPVE